MFSWTHRRRKGSVVGGHHGEWGSGARAPSGDNWTRGRAPGPWSGGEGGEAPLKLKAFWSLDVQRSRQI